MSKIELEGLPQLSKPQIRRFNRGVATDADRVYLAECCRQVRQAREKSRFDHKPLPEPSLRDMVQYRFTETSAREPVFET